MQKNKTLNTQNKTNIAGKNNITEVLGQNPLNPERTEIN